MSDATLCIACGAVGTVTTCAGAQRPCVPAAPGPVPPFPGPVPPFGEILAALGGHVDGYTEIASEGGVHWYQRDDDST